MPKQSKTKTKATTGTRSSTMSGRDLYLKFVRDETAKIAKEHSEYDKKKVRKLALAKWADASVNPKNKKKEEKVADEED